MHEHFTEAVIFCQMVGDQLSKWFRHIVFRYSPIKLIRIRGKTLSNRWLLGKNTAQLCHVAYRLVKRGCDDFTCGIHGAAVIDGAITSACIEILHSESKWIHEYVTTLTIGIDKVYFIDIAISDDIWRLSRRPEIGNNTRRFREFRHSTRVRMKAPRITGEGIENCAWRAAKIPL